MPGEGESLVGISLTPAQMPSEPLYAGDTVRIVTTPGDQGEVTDEDPVTIEATVVGVSRVEETGETVVDVSVPRGRRRPTWPPAPPPAASRSSWTPGSAEPWR